MVVHGHRQHLLGPALADDVLVEFFLDVAGGRDVGEQALGAAAPAFFLVDDRLAQLDAFAADVDVARALDEGADVAVTFAAEGTIGVAVAARAAGRLASSSASARVFRRHAVSFFSNPT